MTSLAVTASGAAAEAVAAHVPALVAEGVAGRLFDRDATLWGQAAESEAATRLSWVGLGRTSRHLVGAIGAHAADPILGRVLGTGFCGGFTTFGTASLDAARLALDGRPGRSLGCALANLVGGVLAAVVGLALGGAAA